MNNYDERKKWRIEHARETLGKAENKIDEISHEPELLMSEAYIYAMCDVILKQDLYYQLMHWYGETALFTSDDWFIKQGRDLRKYEFEISITNELIYWEKEKMSKLLPVKPNKAAKCKKRLSKLYNKLASQKRFMTNYELRVEESNNAPKK